MPDKEFAAIWSMRKKRAIGFAKPSAGNADTTRFLKNFFSPASAFTCPKCQTSVYWRILETIWTSQSDGKFGTYFDRLPAQLVDEPCAKGP